MSASELLITADDGGSSASRSRQRKVTLQRLADELRSRLAACHFPPRTSKWNKIERRIFSYITLNWRGRPLTNHTVIVNLISNTITRQNLRIELVGDQDMTRSARGGDGRKHGG